MTISNQTTQTTITDPVIIGHIGAKTGRQGTFVITSRTSAAAKPIQGDVPVSYWNPDSQAWSPVMPLDRLVRFVPFDFFEAELTDQDLTYP